MKVAINNFYKDGFTLIELLITVSIIGVLFSIGVFGYAQTMKNSRDTQRKVDLTKISNALENYYKDYEKYPISLKELKTKDYLKTIPVDPRTKDSFNYSKNTDSSSYVLSIKLEMNNKYIIMTPQGKMTNNTIITVIPKQAEKTFSPPKHPNIPEPTATDTISYPTKEP
jgi:prepilin-type N-terminal cleavage/methylation domain-containing protein